MGISRIIVAPTPFNPRALLLPSASVPQVCLPSEFGVSALNVLPLLVEPRFALLGVHDCTDFLAVCLNLLGDSFDKVRSVPWIFVRAAPIFILSNFITFLQFVHRKSTLFPRYIFIYMELSLSRHKLYISVYSNFYDNLYVFNFRNFRAKNRIHTKN